MKKYELTDETIKINEEITLYRIKALMDFGNVKKGDLGGFVQSETNLSHNGNCWIYNDAKVFDSARILDSAEIFGSARVYDTAMVYGSAEISCSARVSGSARVYGSARVF